MANDPLATEYEATIWTLPNAFPAGGTVATSALSSTAGLNFAPSSGDTMVYCYNNSTRTVNVYMRTATATSSALSDFTIVKEVITAGAFSKVIVSRDAGSLLFTGSGAATNVTVINWGCTKTAAS